MNVAAAAPTFRRSARRTASAAAVSPKVRYVAKGTPEQNKKAMAPERRFLLSPISQKAHARLTLGLSREQRFCTRMLVSVDFWTRTKHDGATRFVKPSRLVRELLNSRAHSSRTMFHSDIVTNFFLRCPPS